MSKLQGEILTLPKMSGSVSPPKSLSGNVGAKTVNIGEDGATFIPSVSADGVISWTNDKGLPNPEPVNIKGAKGDKGDKGDLGANGKDGKSAYQIAVDEGFEGTETEWLESLHGKDGVDGVNGVDGKDGYTPVKGVDYFDGQNGQNGKDGVDGRTPVKGTDYYTEADKAEMVSAVIAALPKYNGEVEAV